MSLALTVRRATGSAPIHVDPTVVILGGYSAREAAERDRHVDELRRIGIEPPATVPAFWQVSPWLVTTASRIEVQGERTSGEIEFALIGHEGRTYLAVASDQTDREVERSSIPRSKQLCPKVLGETVVPIEDALERWDEIVIESEISGDGATWHPYQRSALGAILEPDALVRAACGVATVPDGTILLSGTVPIVDGETRYDPHFRGTMTLPGIAKPLTLRYEVAVLPEIGEQEARS